MKKTLGGGQPREGGGRVGVFHHPFDRDFKRFFSGLSQKRKNFDVLVQLRRAMKKPGAGAPNWADGFPRCSSPC
jgi:hypothetical protein